MMRICMRECAADVFAVGRVGLTLIREKLPKNIRYSLIINEIREKLPEN